MELPIEQQLGLSLSLQDRTPAIRIDNGDNKMGKNATGEFVIKTKNEAGDFERKKLGKSLEGVILASKARLMSKYDSNNPDEAWWTPEFNPLDTSEIVSICKGSKVVFQATYKEIKNNSRFVSMDPAGNKKNNFSYITVVYLDQGEDIVKIELTGLSRGNWIDYSSSMTKQEKSFLKQITELYIEENTDGSFECKFKKVKDIENNAQTVQRAIGLLESFKQGKPQLTTGTNEVASLPEKSELAEDPFEGIEDNPEEEIKVEDIPF